MVLKCLKCLGVWLCIFGLANTDPIHFSTHSSGSLWSAHLALDKKRHTLRDITITLIQNIYKFIDYEQIYT